MPCGSAVHFASVKPSGFASCSCANCHVLVFVALVRIADSRCELPVLYSTRVPGSSISGRAQHEAHPVRALHPRAVVPAARRLQPRSHRQQIFDRDVALPRLGIRRQLRKVVGDLLIDALDLARATIAMPTSAEMTLFDADLMLAAAPRARR